MIIEDKRIIDKIDSFKAHLPETMQNFQRAKVPIRLNINWTRCPVYYKYDNVEIVINWKQDIVLNISNIRFYNQTSKNANMKFTKPLKTLIDNSEVQPLLFFINGTFIKWSKITVVYDYTSVYYVIKGVPELIKANPIINDVQILSLPFKTFYSETGSMSVDDIWYPFVFDENGNFTTSHSAKYTYIGTTDDTLVNIGTYEFTECNHIPIGIPNETKIYPENIFIFDKTGKFMNVPIEIDRNILHVNNGIIDYYKTIILYKVADAHSLDNINKIVDDSENEIIAALAANLKSGTKLENWQKDILEMFDLPKENGKPNYYDKFIKSMSYDFNLFDDIYKEENNIVSEFYSGLDMLSNKNSEGYFVIPRRHKGNVDCYVMVFVNNLLYNYTRMIKYYTNKVMIPTLGLVANDSIEIVFFHNAMNKVLEGFIDENEDRTLLDKDLFNNDLSIFIRDPEITEYNYPSYGKQMFELPYYIENDIWIINSGMNTNRSCHTATGTSTNCMVQGGIEFSSYFNNTIEYYNTNIWHIVKNNINFTAYGTATGTSTSCMVQGGTNRFAMSETMANDYCYEYDIYGNSNLVSKLNSKRMNHSATGTSTNCMVQGGSIGMWMYNAALNNTESYNGNIWSTDSTMLNNGRQSHSATGTSTNCMVQGGDNNSRLDTTESYNGSAWTANSSLLNITRFIHSATGTSTNCMVQGGDNSIVLNTTELYNDNVWSISISLNTARQSHSATGDGTNCMVQGGDGGNGPINIAESYHKRNTSSNRIRFDNDYPYNKSLTFASKNQFRSNSFINNIVDTNAWIIDSATLNTAKSDHSATGTSTNCMVQGGVSGNNLNTTESYNGSTWTLNTATLNIARNGHSATGTSTNCMAQGGWNSIYLNTTESYNGSVWTANSAILNTTRYKHTATGTSTNCMVQCGLDIDINTLNTTESYNGNTWTTNSSKLNTARYEHSATGTSTNCMAQGGFYSISINTTESYNGSVWTTNSSKLNIVRNSHSATGTSTNCMVQGGNNNGKRFNTTESYNGSTWTNSSKLNTTRYRHTATGTSTNCMVQAGINDESMLNTTESYNKSVGDFKFILSDDFTFCNDKNRYAVFINGRLAPSTLYELNLYDPIVPYDNQSIYLRKELFKDETLDIFYLPIKMNIETNSTVPDNGIVQAGNLYPFTPERFMIFINGKKIPAKIKVKDIKAINLVEYDSHNVSISKDPKSKFNLNIFSVNPKIKELYDAYINLRSSKFDEFVSKAVIANPDKLYTMIGVHPLKGITNNEPNNSNTSITRDILYREIIRDYFTADRGVKQASGFTENFENRNEIYKEYDPEGNGIVHAADAVVDDNLPMDRTYKYEDIPDPRDRPIKE